MYPDNLFWDFNLYNICLTIGLIAVVIVLDKYLEHRKVPPKVQNFYLIVGVLTIGLGIICANLTQSIYHYIETGVFTFNAGMTFYGGLIGGIIVFFIGFFVFGKILFKEKENIKYSCDLFAVAPCCITIGHAFGRLGCLFAGCCYGRQVDGFPGLPMTVWKNGMKIHGYFIPTQLYESIFLFILFGVTTFLYFKKIDWNFVVYLIGYGIWRFIIEFFRTDDRGELLPGLTPSQWISVGLIAAGLIILGFKIYKIFKAKKTGKKPVRTENIE